MSPNPGKILDLSRLHAIANALHAESKRIVLCHGTFDLLHIGHIRYFKQAASIGDVVIVTLTADQYVNKGPDRPVFNQTLRAEHIAALGCVDYVAICHEATGLSAIQQIKPNVYFKGSEYQNPSNDMTGNIVKEREAVVAHGGTLEFSDEIVFSSSQLLNKHFERYPPEAIAYLEQFRRQHGIEDIHGSLESVRALKILVVGDAIIDEYHYTNYLGYSGKYSVPTVKLMSEERFAGGAMAVANHCAALAGEVTLFSALGDRNSHEAFIRAKLADNVNAEFVQFRNAPTLCKRRFLDQDMNKLFEVYEIGNSRLNGDLERHCLDWLEQNLEQYDGVVVSDFGNGFISDTMARLISEKAKFLALNTQLNSENRGYHVVTRYPHADFISLNEQELRMATHDRHGDIEQISAALANSMQAAFLAVTLGPKGTWFVDRSHAEQLKIPALSTQVVDRIGAGDAFLSITGCILASGISPRIALFAGAAAAAQNVQEICNREPIKLEKLYKFLETLLKV